MFVESLEFLVALLFVDFIGIPHPKLNNLNSFFLSFYNIKVWVNPEGKQILKINGLTPCPMIDIYSFFLSTNVSFYNRSLGSPWGKDRSWGYTAWSPLPSVPRRSSPTMSCWTSTAGTTTWISTSTWWGYRTGMRSCSTAWSPTMWRRWCPSYTRPLSGRLVWNTGSSFENPGTRGFLIIH